MTPLVPSHYSTEVFVGKNDTTSIGLMDLFIIWHYKTVPKRKVKERPRNNVLVLTSYF